MSETLSVFQWSILALAALCIGMSKNRCSGNNAPHRALYGNGFRSQGINWCNSANALHGRHHGCGLLQAHSRLEDCGKPTRPAARVKALNQAQTAIWVSPPAARVLAPSRTH